MVTFDLCSRRNKLKQFLDETSCLLFHTRDIMQKGDEGFFHSIDSNFRYFFSNIEYQTLVLVYLEGEGLKVKLGIEKRTEIQEKFFGKINFESISKSCNVDTLDISNIDELIDEIKDKVLNNQFKSVYSVYEGDKNYFSTFKKHIDKLKIELSIEIENKFKDISELRIIKDDLELQAIEKANQISKKVFEYTLSKLKSAHSEQELFAHLSFKTFEQHSTHAFYPIIASGKNATILHYEKHDAQLMDNELILFDFGSEYLGYKSDISRTVPKSGKFTKRQKEVYESVLRVQEYAFSQIKEGVDLVEYEKNVVRCIGEELVLLGLISKDDLDNDVNCIRAYFPHRTSHFLGLDTHDCGNYKTTMKEGMVLTVEPGIYIEDEGIGIRIEDNVVIRKNGFENLSKDILKSVEEIETLLM